jgi:hypothetical protein
MDPFVTLLEVHKLMYFMQEAGEPLRLQYAKAAYGPYAENLRHVLRAVEGHLVAGYADGGDAPDKQIELVPGAMKLEVGRAGGSFWVVFRWLGQAKANFRQRIALRFIDPGQQRLAIRVPVL